MRFFISAGEASGDLHASRLITELRQQCQQQARFCFFGGDLMANAAGERPVVHYREMNYMGFAEVLRNIGKVRHNLALASRLVEKTHPDAVILVDYPSFNLRIARHAHSLGIPVYYYISPKVWAWKEYRVNDIRHYTRRVLSILPFEVPFYRRHGMEIDYVGNPSKEEVDLHLQQLTPRQEFIERHSLNPNKPIIALLPGSRNAEISSNLPLMLEAVRPLLPKYQAVIGGAPSVPAEFYRRFTTRRVLNDDSFSLMAHASAALVTSGTATLECALTGTPQVVCYRHNGSRITYSVMKSILHIQAVSLPNLIAGRQIVPELLLHNCTPVNILTHLVDILPGHPGRELQLQGYADMRRALGPDIAPARAASIILHDLAPKV